jgi:CHAD domain-containing protein
MIHSIIELMQRNSLTTEEYHELRKKLKELKYNLSLADKKSKQIVEKIFSEKELSELEEALGTWHDHIIIISRLKKTTEENVNLQPLIEEVVSRTQRRCDAFLKKISNQFQKKAVTIKHDGE